MKMNLFSAIINLNTTPDPISIIVKFHQHASYDKILLNECKQNTVVAVYTGTCNTLILIIPIKHRKRVKYIPTGWRASCYLMPIHQCLKNKLAASCRESLGTVEKLGCASSEREGDKLPQSQLMCACL